VNGGWVREGKEALNHLFISVMNFDVSSSRLKHREQRVSTSKC
jgi:hypothetical protein